MIYPFDRHGNTEVLLNSLIQHPPLYTLQKSVGHDPRKEIDSRAQHNITVFSENSEATDRKIWTDNALMLADDFLNCSEDYHTQLSKVLEEEHPNTWKLVKSILDMAEYYDLNDSAQNLKFVRRVIRKLPLSSGWRRAREIKDIRSLIQAYPINQG